MNCSTWNIRPWNGKGYMRSDMALLVKSLEFADHFIQDLQDAVLGDSLPSGLDVDSRNEFLRLRFQRIRQFLQACQREAATR